VPAWEQQSLPGAARAKGAGDLSVMATQVCAGATLQCSFGTVPSTFAASGDEVTASGAAGVVTDVAPSNVPPFGLCTSGANPQVASANSPQPCVPVLSAWTAGSTSVTIGEVPALDDSSQCSCTWGGVITVSDPGQAAVTLD
jgi:hypothetical protein